MKSVFPSVLFQSEFLRLDESNDDKEIDTRLDELTYSSRSKTSRLYFFFSSLSLSRFFSDNGL